jgi:hypothetical protein
MIAIKQNPWRRWLRRFLLLFFIVIPVLWWFYISSPVVNVSLSKNSYCKMQFNQWYTGRCMLYYYEDSVCIGRVKLGLGLFTHPLAVFPGSDGKTVVCFSRLDTTYAAFTVDFSKRIQQGTHIPAKLQDAVNYSNFEVRACTRQEVNFVADYIRTVDSNLLAKHLIGGETSEQSRANALLFLRYSTEEHNWHDPVLENAYPQILPEN